jgi:hypothetical protein
VSCGYIGQKPTCITGHAGAHDFHAFAVADEPRFCFDLPFALIAQQAGAYIYSQGEAFAIRTDLDIPKRQYRSGDIRKPQHGSGMNGAERIKNAFLYRHGADHTIVSAFLDEEFDFAGFSAFFNPVIDGFHFFVSWLIIFFLGDSDGGGLSLLNKDIYLIIFQRAKRENGQPGLTDKHLSARRAGVYLV